MLVRREGISLGALEDGVCLSQHIPREPAKAGTLAGLFLSAKPQPLSLPVSLLVRLTALARLAKSGTIQGRTGVGLWLPVSFPLTFLISCKLVSLLLCGTDHKRNPVSAGI